DAGRGTAGRPDATRRRIRVGTTPDGRVRSVDASRRGIHRIPAIDRGDGVTVAKYQDIGGSGRLFVGQDLDFVFEVLDRDGDPVDVSGWSFSMVISPSTTAAATLTLPGSVGGTYNAARALNTQRMTFSLSDTDSAKLTNKAYH